MIRLNMSLNDRASIALLTGAILISLGGCDSSDAETSIDNCPLLDNSDQLDTDADGQGDACDIDDDGDGFQDSVDPAPLDSSRPGDFSTPEAILNDPVVRNALDEAAAAGSAVRTDTGQMPPQISGYYNRPDGEGIVIETSDDSDVGAGLVGRELRIEQNIDNSVAIAGVSYTDSTPIFFAVAEGSLIRGEGNRFTIYSRTKSTCTEAGSDYDVFAVSIASAEWDPEASNIINSRNLWISLDTEGDLTASCASRISGATEYASEWSVYDFPLQQSVQPASLIYMCVDEDAAYAPTETWTSSDNMSCSCTESYQISCQ